MSETTAAAPTQALDDVMLAMDVVDTLRHRDLVLSQELDAGAREEALVKRLREIYSAQGISVPDDILKQGVKALEEKRFTYTPPEPSVSVSLAKLYVTRDKWWKQTAIALAGLVAAITVWQVGVVGPQQAEARATEIALTETIPEALTFLSGEIEEVAVEPLALARRDALVRQGQEALIASDIRGARSAETGLENLYTELTTAYDVTVVSRPGELSGVFRIPNDVPNARNYYLIVEARDAAGRAIPITLQSEEDQQTRRVGIWGQRVTQSTFETVGADKQDDQIIQDAVIGTKDLGMVTPEFESGVLDGVIFEW